MNLESGVLQVHVEDIIPNRFQPRLNFDEQGLKELADSIREHGIIQPLVLRKLGDKYEIIAGERRYKAAQIVGLQTVPAVIANIDDNKSAEVALVENVQRRDLTAIEEARSYKNLLDKGYLTQEQLAKRMGLSQPAIANKLRLLNLDEEVQQALLEERISERHARTLLSINDKAAQREWLHRVINERLTVRQLDIELKKIKSQNNLLSEDEEITGTGDVPLVSGLPSIDDIKANAMDLSEFNKQKNNPSSAPERLEPLDLMAPQGAPTMPANAEFNNPIQDNPFTAATTIPEFNIATPNSSSTFVPVESLMNPPVDNSKFINNTPAPAPSAAEFFNPNNNFQSMDSLEIFDVPSANSSFVDAASVQIQNEQDKKSELMQPINVSNSTLSDVELNANNKFFTPLSENSQTITIENPLEKEVDPMAAVETLGDPKPLSEQLSGMSLKDAISNIRNCIEGLGNNGFFIDVEEIDFDSSYQITMRIHKDN